MAPRPPTPDMSALEMGFYLFEVLHGNKPALDGASGQTVGISAYTNPNAFAIPLLQICFFVWIYLRVLEATGKGIAGMIGLRDGLRERFAASFLELAYYSVSIALMAVVCWDADWFWPSGWGNIMRDGRLQSIPGLAPYKVPADLKLLYLLETAYYLVSFARLMTTKRKKDFIEMAFHHVVTALLLLLSFTVGYLRVGAVVIFLHNLFDPFMHVAKCSNYAKTPVLPDVAFVSCMVVFAASRLYYYPIAIWNAWNQVCNGSRTCPGGVWDKDPVENALIVLLVALLPVHVFWFVLILKVLKKALQSKGVESDVRSDSEDEEDEPPAKKRQ